MVIEDSLTPISDQVSAPKDGWMSLAEYVGSTHSNLGIWWLKTEIILEDRPPDLLLGFYSRGFISAYEIYWDGRRIGRNGRLGSSKDSEKAGTLSSITHLPDDLALPGPHTLLLRISNHSSISWNWHRGIILLGHYELFRKNIFSRALKFYFIFGILFITALFNLFLFFSRGMRTAHMIFSLLCLAIMADFVTASIEFFMPVSSRFVKLQFLFFPLESLLIGILFTVFFIYEFDFPQKKVILGVVGVHVFLYVLHGRAYPSSQYEMDVVIGILALTTPLFIWAAVKKKDGSLIALAGFVISSLAFLFDFWLGINRPIFLTTIMVFCYSFSIARQFARSEKKEKEALLRSSRLEIEILKKYINPHFLMNSMTSIIVWMRKKPSTAVTLVESLAEEFRMISQVSSLRTIPISQEIAICRAHLRIMSIRRGGGFTLDVQGVEEEDEIPPLIFHTLIENGLSHGYWDKNEGKFQLVRSAVPGGVRFTLNNDSSIREDSGLAKLGLGLKYVRIRLEETYHARWKLLSGPISGGWETVIIIRDQ